MTCALTKNPYLNPNKYQEYEVFQIKQDSLHIGSLIKGLREYKGLSQDALARMAFSNRSTISQIELGHQDCPYETLLAIKIALDVEILPLRDSERPAFRELLYIWYDVISERDWEAANKARSKLSVIKLIPHDKELNTLFLLFECRLLLGLNELEESKAIIDVFENCLADLSDIQRYHYYYNQGTYNVRCKQHQKALDFYLKSYDLMKCGLEKSVTLYFNIAICYEELGRTALAANFLEEACKLQSVGHSNVPEFQLYNSLGAIYASTGHLQRAKDLLDKAYAIALIDYKAKANEDTKIRMGMVLINYGYMYHTANKWSRAIEYLDNAILYIPKGNAYYLEALYLKIRSLIGMGNSLACTEMLADGIHQSKDNEVYTVMFEALKILISPNEETVKHLDKKILTFLLTNKIFNPALDYAVFLRDFYRAKGRGFKTRALEMSEIISNILSGMREGGVIE